MTYNICMNAAKELGAFLEAIVKSNDSTPQPPNPPSSPLSSTDTQQDPMEQIIKYKELLDKGIIDEVEFKRKKKELLGL
ncbi:MAG: SHOCT domain-containing protein [Akkermansia sp.]|nr:SHOCT domain-containing protein [Akkermansia sp.]